MALCCPQVTNYTLGCHTDPLIFLMKKENIPDMPVWPFVWGWSSRFRKQSRVVQFGKINITF